MCCEHAQKSDLPSKKAGSRSQNRAVNRKQNLQRYSEHFSFKSDGLSVLGFWRISSKTLQTQSWFLSGKVHFVAFAGEERDKQDEK